MGDTDRERQFLYTHAPRIRSYFANTTIVGPGYAASPSEYARELYSHKFCLLLRCDGPAGSRFFDAVASDCIPVILSDSFKLAAAPFVERLQYDAFTVTLGTAVFQRDPVAALDWVTRMPRFRYARMFAALQHAKRALVWTHPESLVHEYVVREAHEAAASSVALLRSGSEADRWL